MFELLYLQPLQAPLETLERCLSGRKEQFAKLSYWQRYRGFESRPLRSTALDLSKAVFFLPKGSFYKSNIDVPHSTTNHGSNFLLAHS